MPTTFQVTFDCADPHKLASFWAKALGYEKEDFSELIDRLKDSGQITDDALVTVDGHPEFKTAAACIDPEGIRARLLFQVVPESKTVKNRVHLDLNVGHERVQDEVARLLKLGATKLWAVGEEGREHCVTLQDPEGNEFCVQ